MTLTFPSSALLAAPVQIAGKGRTTKYLWEVPKNVAIHDKFEAKIIF